MRYILHYDICAVILYLFSIFFVFLKKDLKKIENKVFLVILFNGLLSSIFDIWSAYVIEHSTQIPTEWLAPSSYLFLTIHNMVAFLFFIYVNLATGGTAHETKLKHFIIGIPFLCSMSVMALNPFLHWVFYFDENKIYHHGSGLYLLYVSAFIYIVGTLVLTIRYHNTLGFYRTVWIIGFISSAAIVILVQMLNPDFLLELFIQSVVYLGLIFLMEDSESVYNIHTSAYNRKAFQKDLKDAMNHGYQVDVIFVKFINYSYYLNLVGFDVMNIVMTSIFKWCAQFAPEVTVYDGEMGNVILIVSGDAKEHTHEIVEKMKVHMGRRWVHRGLDVSMDVQIMSVRIPDEVDSPEVALTLMERVFPRKGEKVQVISNMEIEPAQRKMDVGTAVYRGLREKNFEVYYQPIWDKETRRITRAEALLRLDDPELGMISPEEFIPIAERNGTIMEIGAFVLEEVCKFIASGETRKAGIECINVNLSAVQCLYYNISESFHMILDKYKVEISDICLEITESATIENGEFLRKTLREFKALGFKLAMDDFGTGYSNIRSLSTMDFDVIKIDKSVLWAVDKEEEGKDILELCVHLIQSVKKKITVEGVETIDQKNYLLDLGCDYLQGYYFSKPLPRDLFLKFTKDFNSKN